MPSVLLIIIVLLALYLLFFALARHHIVGLSVLVLVLLLIGIPMLGVRHARMRMRARQVEVQAIDRLRVLRLEQGLTPGLEQQAERQRQLHERARIEQSWVQQVQAVQAWSASPDVGPPEAASLASAPRSPAAPDTLEAPLVATAPASASSDTAAEIEGPADIESLGTTLVPAETVAALEPATSPSTDGLLAAATSDAASGSPATPPAATTDPAPAPTVAAVTEPPTASRPDWVQSPPQEVAGQPAQVLVSDPYETGAECDVDMQRRIRSTIQDYADLHSTGVGAPADLNLPLHPADIRHVSRERFVDVIQTSVGPMKQVHQLIVFDESFRRVLDRRVAEAVVGQRLVRTGAFSGGILLLVGSLFGILKGGAARRQARTVSA